MFLTSQDAPEVMLVSESVRVSEYCVSTDFSDVTLVTGNSPVVSDESSLMIPKEDFTDVILVIDYAYGFTYLAPSPTFR